MSEVYTMDRWHELIPAMQSGKPFEVDEEIFYYWLEALPPVYMGRVQVIEGKPVKCSFGFADGAEPVTDFWQDGGRFYGCRSSRMNPWAFA